MLRFVLATLAALALVLFSALFGGWWSLAALLFMTLLTMSLDELTKGAARAGAPEEEFPAADWLSVAIALGGFVLMALTVAGAGQRWHGAPERIAHFVAAGMFLGQVGNANAHELIHRGSRALRGLGVLVYVSLLFGHHASAHPLVHHVAVATKDDPNTARRGESFYRFWPRAWIGSFRAGARAESRRMERAGRPLWRHPYLLYLCGAAAMLALALWIGGPRGLLIYLLLALYAQMQLLLSDYVQHYGLERRILPNGRPEPVAARHSWNAPHPVSSALMLNAPRHSDHHAHPGRPYPNLTLPEGAPMLPFSLPVMSTLALLPRRWRRVMDRRLAALAPPERGPSSA